MSTAGLTNSSIVARVYGVARRTPIGLLVILAVPQAIALSLPSRDYAGFNLGGIVWVLTLLTVLPFLAIELIFSRRVRVEFPLVPFLGWAAIVWGGLLWRKQFAIHDVQDAIQICSPILMAIAACLFIRDRKHLNWLLIVFWTPVGMIVWDSFYAYFAEGMGPGDRIGTERVYAMLFSMVACIQVAKIPDRPVTGYLGWLACLSYPLITGGRTVTAAIALLPVFNPRIRGVGWRIVLLCLCGCVALGLFYTPVIQNRFFHSGSGTLADLFAGNFLAFGRFEAWPLILDEALKYPIIGQGTGSSYHFVPRVWTGMTLCHNDYLRIFFEQGALGLTYYMLLHVWLFLRLVREVRTSEGVIQRAFAAALLGQIVFLCLSVTDNVLIYNLVYTNSWFVMMGAAFGVKGAEAVVADRRADRPSAGWLEATA